VDTANSKTVPHLVLELILLASIHTGPLFLFPNKKLNKQMCGERKITYFTEKLVNSISSVGTQLSIWLELRFPHEASTAGICPFQISANTMM